MKRCLQRRNPKILLMKNEALREDLSTKIAPSPAALTLRSEGFKAMNKTEKCTINTGSNPCLLT